jgi:hypothetical protein
MSARRLTHWVLILLAGLTGCASSRNSNSPNGSAAAQSGVSPLAGITPGAYVRLTLIGGERVSGNVREVTADAVTLDRPRNYSFKERQVALGEIRELKVLEEAGGSNARMSWLAVSLTLIFTFCLYAASTIRIGE